MNDNSSVTPEKKSNRKIFLVGGPSLVLIFAVAASVYIFILSKKGVEGEQQKAKIEEVVLPAIYLEVPPLMVNLNAATGATYRNHRNEIRKETNE